MLKKNKPHSLNSELKIAEVELTENTTLAVRHLRRDWAIHVEIFGFAVVVSKDMEYIVSHRE